MWKTLVAVLLCASAARAQPPGLTRPYSATADAAQRFADAAAKGDVAALATFLQQPVGYGGVWFADPECAKQLAGAGEVVPKAALGAFATCLAKLKLEVSARKASFTDGVVLTYDPGIEIEARFYVDKHNAILRAIGYTARRDLGDALPTITPGALESLRTGGKRETELAPAARAALTAELQSSHRDYAYTWLKICLDAQGTVTGVHPQDASSDAATAAFTTAIKDWTFKPFVAGGTAIPVCASVRLGFPTYAATEERLPLPPLAPEVAKAMPRTIAPGMLEGYRIKGDKLIQPDDDVKILMRDHHLDKIYGVFKLCLDETGRPSSVTILRSSGAPSYDAEITRKMADWLYRPYFVDGTPVAVCTGVTFVYRQKLR